VPPLPGKIPCSRSWGLYSLTDRSITWSTALLRLQSDLQQSFCTTDDVQTPWSTRSSGVHDTQRTHRCDIMRQLLRGGRHQQGVLSPAAALYKYGFHI